MNRRRDKTIALFVRLGLRPLFARPEAAKHPTLRDASPDFTALAFLSAMIVLALVARSCAPQRKCGMTNAECGITNAECGMRNEITGLTP
jgi:hypothetical protein